MHDILIVGISTVDAIARPIDQIPAPGGLRFFDQLKFSTGGCAANCAIALAKLGPSCEIITRLGTDMLGEFVLNDLRTNGVEHAGVVRDTDVSTAFTFVAVDSDGERRFFHTVGTNATLCRKDIPDQRLAQRRFVFVTGAMLMDTLDGSQTVDVLTAARRQGAITLLDTVFVEAASRDEWRRRIGQTLPHLDYFIPSLAEAQALTGLDDPAEIARSCQADGAKHVVIKLAHGGAFYRDADGQEGVVPAFHVDKVVDATGAGDCWCAGFLVGLHENLSLPDAARLGNAVASHGIQSAGATAGIPSLDNIRRFINGG